MGDEARGRARGPSIPSAGLPVRAPVRHSPLTTEARNYMARFGFEQSTGWCWAEAQQQTCLCQAGAVAEGD